MRRTIAILCGIVLCLLAGFLAGRHSEARRTRDGGRVDTLVVWREISDSAAVLEATKAAGWKVISAGRMDSLLAEAAKPEKVVEREVRVVVTKDSLIYVHVPMEEQTWTGRADSVDYKITTTGYNTGIKSVAFRYPERTITRETTRESRVGFGLAAGPTLAVTPRGRVTGGLGVTAGVYLKF